MTGIYQITCLASGKVYIGQAVDIEKRIANHKAALKSNSHQNCYLQNSWNKHGEQSFIFSVLEQCEETLLTQREQHWIDYYGGINNGKNYNFRQAGTKGKLSSKSKKLLSESALKLRQDPEWVERNKQGIQKSWTPERRAAQSSKQKGQTLSEEHKESLKQAAQQKVGTKRQAHVKEKISNTLIGHKIAEETKAKISDSVKATLELKKQQGTAYKHDEQTKERIRAAAKEQWRKRREAQNV